MKFFKGERFSILLVKCNFHRNIASLIGALGASPMFGQIPLGNVALVVVWKIESGAAAVLPEAENPVGNPVVELQVLKMLDFP